MLTKTQQDRIARQCADVITESISAFPEMLGRMDVTSAAAIVADLIKSQTKPSDQPEKSLEDIIRGLVTDSVD